MHDVEGEGWDALLVVMVVVEVRIVCACGGMRNTFGRRSSSLILKEEEVEVEEEENEKEKKEEEKR
ncbi:hypothetical protein E2C01_044172 [Portunus trituberculatus]|uniref:Uncharacterized protein n=1 Tax=Portunus trituberculatus TaxID=210409 RepID=A0A5B7G1J9_PORTR|nr:hypothetical protein [Portunus trituberculatus]